LDQQKKEETGGANIVSTVSTFQHIPVIKKYLNLKNLLRKLKFLTLVFNTNQLQLMNSAEKLQWARLIAIASLLLITGLLVLIADDLSSLWLADMERELASSLEVVSSSLAGR
jgi:hypothetical protein